MLLEFDNKNASEVLLLFNEGKIAQLDIKPVIVDGNRRFVINYTTTTELNAHQKVAAVNVLNSQNTYMVRMRVTELLNKFIENMATNTVTRFELEFSVIDRTSALLNTQVQFAKPLNTVTDDSVKNCLDALNGIVTNMGIGPVKIDGIFKRESSGKGRKHIQITVAEIVEALQTVLTEDN